MARLRAVGPYVIVKIDLEYMAKHHGVEFDKKTRTVKSHGIITETKDEDFDRLVQYSTRGKVVEIGPEAFTLPHHKGPWCEVGDLIVFDKYTGDCFKDEDTGDWYRAITDEQVRGIIEE